MSHMASDSPIEGIGQDHFDVTVVGTGLSESIAASALAKQGFSVLHLDEHEYYGDRHASLTVDEMMQWVDEIRASSATQFADASYEFPSEEFKNDLPRVARQYSLSLFPTVLPARGDLIETLIEEDVGKYVNFRLVDGVAIHQAASPGEASSTRSWKRVPAGKDQIFKDSSLSLLEKRRLMKFIMFASSEKGFSLGGEDVDPLLRGKEAEPIIDYLRSSFQLSNMLAETIAYGIAFCSSPSDPVGPAMIRMNRYFKSIGRYGSSPFLVAQYGGIGEITQAFCRACAVHGGTYILGSQSKISDLQISPTPSQNGASHPIVFSIPAHPSPISTDLLISGSPLGHPSIATNEPSTSSLQANCLAILKDMPPSIKAAFASGTSELEDPDDLEAREMSQDVLILIFPPGSVEGAPVTAVRALLMGSGTGSCPADQFTLYVQADMTNDAKDPKTVLLPYITRLLDRHPAEFLSFYSSNQTKIPSILPPSTHRRSSEEEIQPTAFANPELCEGLDLEARRAKAILKLGLSILPTRREEPATRDIAIATDVLC